MATPTNALCWVATFCALVNLKKRNNRAVSFPPSPASSLIYASHMQTPCMLPRSSTQSITMSSPSWRICLLDLGNSPNLHVLLSNHRFSSSLMLSMSSQETEGQYFYATYSWQLTNTTWEVSNFSWRADLILKWFNSASHSRLGHSVISKKCRSRRRSQMSSCTWKRGWRSSTAVQSWTSLWSGRAVCSSMLQQRWGTWMPRSQWKSRLTCWGTSFPNHINRHLQATLCCWSTTYTNILWWMHWQISMERSWLADSVSSLHFCAQLNVHLFPLSPRLFTAVFLPVVMTKPWGLFCAISTPCFILEEIKCFGITLPSPTSFSLRHGQPSALVKPTLRFLVMNHLTTGFSANLASASWQLVYDSTWVIYPLPSCSTVTTPSHCPSMSTKILMLVRDMRLATGLTTWPLPSWSMRTIFVVVFRSFFKFVSFSGSKQWTCSDFVISVLRCFGVHISG